MRIFSVEMPVGSFLPSELLLCVSSVKRAQNSDLLEHILTAKMLVKILGKHAEARQIKIELLLV